MTSFINFPVLFMLFLLVVLYSRYFVYPKYECERCKDEKFIEPVGEGELVPCPKCNKDGTYKKALTDVTKNRKSILSLLTEQRKENASRY